MMTRHQTASACVVDVLTKRILLVDHQGSRRLQFPGGHVEDYEAPGEAAIRETYEETRVQISLVSPHGPDVDGMRRLAVPWRAYEIPAPAKARQGARPAEAAHLHLDWLYLATGSSLYVPRVQLHEVHGAEWVPVDTLHTIPRVRADVPMLARLALRTLTSSLTS